ncbi:uncharacterized protein C20orf96 homolog [Acomys russatus]|uniref:uncharacterized protein C20orf96 homolog n=1 Tax=Acomys russatus TaxID=60746 RepID=UPI0021E2A1E3|nr:uncharacterized protein C20orf96 homolog [Acomys russatus]
MAQKNTHSRTHSSGHQFQVPRSKKNLKPFTLPPLGRTKNPNKSEMKMLTSMQPGVHSYSSVDVANRMKNLRLGRREHPHHGKTQSKIQLMRSMLRSQRTSLQELYHHEGFLSKLNQELAQSIQDMENSWAVNARSMLQQQVVLGNTIDILEYSNKKRVQQLKDELQEWKEKEERKTNSLQQEVDQLNAEILKTQEEVNFLSTYMDHEYPVRSVQIANCIRQVQQAKDRQQDELDNLREMREVVLARFSREIQEKKNNILMSLVVKTQKPHEKLLLLKSRNSQNLQRHVDWLRERTAQLRKEMPALEEEVEQMCAEVSNPREVVFKDILLQRPKCTPDMDVELDIPLQEPFPF